jgi:hypothetical protein
MDILSEEIIWNEFWKQYSKKPKSWRIYSGLSSKGNPELLISGEDGSWIIRRDSLYSGKLGIGGKVSDEVRIKSKVAPFGFREISKDVLDNILMIIEGQKDARVRANILNKILRKPPTTLESIQTQGVLQGPVLHTLNSFPLISEEQERLDVKLNFELNQMKRKLPYI